MSGQNQTPNYTEQGGAISRITSGGKLIVETGATLQLDAGSTQSIASVTDVSVAQTLSGAMNFTGVVKQFGLDISADRTYRHVAVAITMAQINSGFELLPAVASFKYKIVGYYLRFNGGNLGGATDIRISDGNGTPVVVLTVAAAAALSAAEVHHGATIANVTKGAGWLAQLTVNKAVNIVKTGSAGTTLVSVDVMIDYQLAA